MEKYAGIGLRILILLLGLLMVASCTSTISIQDLAGEYYNLGNAYYGIRKYAEAVTYYTLALDLKPDLLDSQYNLALALLQLKRYQEADVILSDLLMSDPSNINLLLTHGYSLFLQGNKPAALKVYDRILTLVPDQEDALNNSALILWQQGERPEAVKKFLRLAELNEEEDQYLFNLGKLYYESEDYSQAVEWTEFYLESKPDDPAAYEILGLCYQKVEKYYEALGVYEELLALDKQHKGAWFNKAFIFLTRVEDPAKGVTALREALKSGYKDKEKIKALVESPRLLDRGEVEQILKEFGVMPVPETKQEEEAETTDTLQAVS